jgi:hypothetical protein
MFEHGRPEPVRNYARAAAAAAIILTAGVAGLWLGENWDQVKVLWAPELAPASTSLIGGETPAEAAPDESGYEPPLYFAAAPAAGTDLQAVFDEIRLAAGAGVHRHILAVPLPWSGQQADLAPALERLDALFAADPKGRAVIQLNLNPPASWLESHASATVTVDGQSRALPCVASQTWLDDARKAMSLLGEAVKERYEPEQFLGCLLSGLEEGRWHRQGGYDTCQDNANAFRQWLRLRYANDEALRKAWDDPAVTLEDAAPPPAPEASSQTFFLPPADQRHIDFLQFTSESTARAIIALTEHVKAFAGPGIQVFVPYGFTYELPNGSAGHFALYEILESPVDVLVSPVSYVDRGVGGAGGYMGPVNSALAHKKQWLIVDDTRTGLPTESAGNAATPAPAMAAAAGDVQGVQLRNFASALVHGLALAWSDPEGQGWLRDPQTWERLSRIYHAYERVYRPRAEKGTEAAPAEAKTFERIPLMVVVDEASRHYERPGGKIAANLLQAGQSVALRSGVPTQFCLLQDVLRDAVPPASVYWFLNAFRLTPEQRNRLHAILTRENAAAIWMYAPGYIADAPAAENVSATVRMEVKAFAEEARGGSRYSLAGKWAAKDEAFGSPDTWDPLFYIDDEKASILARYEESEKASVALSYCEEGWKSVFVADPGLTPGVLRELLQLLELHLYFRKTVPATLDAAHIGPGLVAVHADGTGDRALDLGRVLDIQDLFDPEIGWPRSRLINLPLYPGETRVFVLTPPSAG